MRACALRVLGVLAILSKANAIPSSPPSLVMLASSSALRSAPNFRARYVARSTPSGGISGLSSNGSQVTDASAPTSRKARSSRRLPTKHQGQITSE
jgi:hypothetical protein